MRQDFALVVAGALLLAGCGSDAPYREARHEGRVGYSDTLSAPARATVTFQGDAAMGPDTIYEYALLRGAQVTRKGGYDWFYIVPPDGAPPAAQARHGSHGDATPYYDAARQMVTLDIVMGRGQRPPNNPAAFDARALEHALKHLK
jgi:hypothetical protein